MKNIKLIVLTLLVVVLFTNCKEKDPLSDLTGLTSFKLKGNDNIPGLENVSFTIDQTQLLIENTDSLPYQSDVSSLVAIFEAIEKTTVKVGTAEQVSGETVNDFTNPVTYVVTAEDGVTVKNYTVKVNVSKINPEAVNWSKKTSAFSDYEYNCLKSVWFKDKALVILGKMDVPNKVAGAECLTSTDGATWQKETIDEDNFPVGIFQGLTTFNDKVYVLGNYSMVSSWGFPMPGADKSIWESTDGISFSKLTTTYTFDGDKINSAIFTLNDVLWVVGGNTLGFGNYNGAKSNDKDFYPPSGLSNRVHSTSDLASWTEADSDILPDEVLRRYSANLVHNGKMYMIGGQGKDGSLLSDVWASSDGKNWSLVSEGQFGARMEAAAISYDGKIWMIGGHTGLGKVSKEILVSEDDGATWNVVEDIKLPDGFAERAGHAVITDSENNVLIIGGYSVSESEGKEEKTMLYDVWVGKLNKLKQ